jgi:uncharacterized protein YaaW (UPF0174 family)
VNELREALDLATDDELQSLTEILFRRKFNPLDYVCTPAPIVVQSQERETWIQAIEQRFQFLAADGFTVLQRRTGEVSYHQVLVQVCRYLKISCSSSLSTEHLEAEIFLFLLNRAWKKLPAAEQATLSGELQQAVSESDLTQTLPAAPSGLLISGSAVAASSVLRNLVLRFMARQYAVHAATYQVASQVASQATQAGVLAVAQIQNQVAMQTASRSMALSAARYGAARGVFALLGPAMWTYFFADLGWRAIATNYSRVIPVIFTLAQIRLTRMSYEIA